MQLLRQQLKQRLVGGSFDRRGGDFDAEFGAQGFADLVGRGARLEFHGEEHSVGLDAKEGRHGHCSK
jgi:hypothetical protein